MRRSSSRDGQRQAVSRDICRNEGALARQASKCLGTRQEPDECETEDERKEFVRELVQKMNCKVIGSLTCNSREQENAVQECVDELRKKVQAEDRRKQARKREKMEQEDSLQLQLDEGVAFSTPFHEDWF